MAVGWILAVVVVASLASRRGRRVLRHRDEEGASYVLAVLLVAAITISMVWFAKETLFDTQKKANDQIQTEVGQLDK